MKQYAVGSIAGEGAAALIEQRVPAGEHWHIERINIRCGGADTEWHLYLGSVGATNELDFTPAGNNDVGEYEPAIYVPAGSILIHRWESVDAGEIASARVQYRTEPATVGSV